MARRNIALWFWSIALTVVGSVLLLNNFLLLDYDAVRLWPLLLVAAGLQVILTGELGISWDTQNFGITRGSIEAGSLLANSGEIDMRVRVLQRPGRLIAGQYTARSRPELVAGNNRATLTMHRGRTWAYSLANWDIGLADDLPWKLALSAFLGEIEADLRGVIIEDARIATGIGDTHVIAPDNPAGPIVLRSTMGNIHLTVPQNMEGSIVMNASPLFGKQILDNRWQEVEHNRYETSGYGSAVEPLDIQIAGTFGDLILN